MKKTIKILAAVLALCFALGAFAACKNRGNPDGPTVGPRPKGKLTVTFKLWYGANPELSPPEITVRKGEASGALPDIPANFRPHYSFLGWYTEDDGGSKVTAATIVTADTDHFLFAHWKGDGVKVIFDPNGGDLEGGGFLYTNEAGGKKSKQVEYGAIYGGPFPTATREGYLFDGWLNTSDGSTVSPNHIVTMLEEHTLAAQWNEDKKVFHFDLEKDLSYFYGNYPGNGQDTELTRVERGGKWWMSAKVKPLGSYIATINFKQKLTAGTTVTFKIDFEDLRYPGAPVEKGLGAWVLNEAMVAWDLIPTKGIIEQKVSPAQQAANPIANGVWNTWRQVDYTVGANTNCLQLFVAYNRSYGYDDSTPALANSTKHFLNLDPDSMRTYITDVVIEPPEIDSEGWYTYDYAFMKGSGEFYVHDYSDDGNVSPGSIAYNDALSRVEITNPSAYVLMQIDNWNLSSLLQGLTGGFTIEYTVSIDYPTALINNAFTSQSIVAQHNRGVGSDGFDFVPVPAARITAATVNAKETFKLTFEISKPVYHGGAAIQFKLDPTANMSVGAKVYIYGMRVKPL